MSAPETPQPDAAIALVAQAPATPANPVRGEASVRINGTDLTLRPSFAALVAAEQELGPLFGLVERAAQGKIGLGETATLLWHCVKDAPAHVTRETLGEALVQGGLAAATPILRGVLGQILGGR